MRFKFLKILYKLFTARDKKIIAGLLLLTVLVSIIETIGISAVMVFISASTNLGFVHKSAFFRAIYQLFGFTSHKDFVIFLGFGLLLFYAFRMALTAIHVYAMSRFAYMRQFNLSKKLFQRLLFLNYKDFAKKDPTSLYQIIIAYPGNVTQIVTAILNIMSESITVACIYTMLFYVHWKMTLVLTLLLMVKVFFIIKIFSSRIRTAGGKNKFYAAMQGRVWNETYHNYKFLKLLVSENVCIKRFANSGLGLATAGTVNLVWQALPRYVLETIGFSILISVILYVTIMYGSAGFIIPIISMYALAFYRFLPSVNKILMGYNQVIFNQHAPGPIYEFLQHDFENLGNKFITFKNKITLSDVSFDYAKKSKVFNKVNLVITKGQRVGIVGESGAGKSTLADIVMGLLDISSGSIVIDSVRLDSTNKKSWREKIGYIPQSIYLFDGTVAQNIVCGRDVDEEKIISACKKAKIYDFLTTKDGISTVVGEGGIRFSGGQKQRVAIARALYNDPDILVLDEATSALDNKIENLIMNEIYDVSKDKTLIIIAHRLTTVTRCDKIYQIKKMKIIDVTSEYNKPSCLSI